MSEPIKALYSLFNYEKDGTPVDFTHGQNAYALGQVLAKKYDFEVWYQYDEDSILQEFIIKTSPIKFHSIAGLVINSLLLFGVLPVIVYKGFRYKMKRY